MSDETLCEMSLRQDRDDARSALDRTIVDLEYQTRTAQTLREAYDEMKADLEAERDEARRQLDEARGALEALNKAYKSLGTSLGAEQHARVEMSRERDEARGDAARLREILRDATERFKALHRLAIHPMKSWDAGRVIDAQRVEDETGDALEAIELLTAAAESIITAAPAPNPPQPPLPGAAPGAVLDPGCVKCIKCRECVGACDCTGGPQTEQECTCYELTGGHQPGCYYNRPRALASSREGVK